MVQLAPDRIEISNLNTYWPDFDVIEIAYIEEPKQDPRYSDHWSFKIHLKEGRIKHLCFLNLETAQKGYFHMFDWLLHDRK
ncbi:MAG: hypothetical protein GY866_37385 [Proteobacteria bacterium]|nr:hypothetical protein [Pseudomonadota bacterium]